MRAPVFMTGATGFLGMEVLARLLEAGDRDVVCLVRAADSDAAEARLDGVLETLWTDPEPYRARVRAVAGDLTSPGLGLRNGDRAALAEEIGAVLHCAASISFDLPLEEARQINVEGTREVIGFAREAKALGRLDRFLHVSTAYVSGAYPGTFGERQLVAGQEFRNTYEQTKNEAEQIVAEADDLAPAVVRPSIVMGESDSGWTPTFNVLYWPLRAFSRRLFDTVPAVAHARVDVVPVDYVADGIVYLLDHSETGVFNLVAGSEAPTVEDLIDLSTEAFGIQRPQLVDPGHPTKLADGEVYVPYFDMRVVFDDARAREVLEPAGIRAPKLSDCFGNLIDYAEAARWGKRPMSRQAARERMEPAAA
jgi:thioester reductase-like protein